MVPVSPFFLLSAGVEHKPDGRFGEPVVGQELVYNNTPEWTLGGFYKLISLMCRPYGAQCNLLVSTVG